MRRSKIDKTDSKLMKVAKELKDALNIDVAVALSSDKGVFIGVNVRALGCDDCSTCAEPVAVGAMMAKGGKRINTIVAWGDKGIVTPCGRCRQMLSKFGDMFVIVSRTRKARLSELLPLPYRH